jgi:hypothetical protein
MAFHNALLRMLLKRQGQLIWIARLRSFSAPQGEQKFLNVILQQHPRSILQVSADQIEEPRASRGLGQVNTLHKPCAKPVEDGGL